MLLLDINNKYIWGIGWHYHIRLWVTLIGRPTSHILRTLIIYHKAAELGLMVLLDINRNPGIYRVEGHSHIWLWEVKSLVSRSLLSRKAAELGDMLLLNINAKAYTGSPMTPPWTLNELERSVIFWSLICHKRAELGGILVLNINRKPYIGSSMTPSHLTLSDLDTSESRSLAFQGLVPVECIS